MRKRKIKLKGDENTNNIKNLSKSLKQINLVSETEAAFISKYLLGLSPTNYNSFLILL